MKFLIVELFVANKSKDMIRATSKICQIFVDFRNYLFCYGSFILAARLAAEYLSFQQIW